MPKPTPDTSIRFTRAASAERKRLARKLSGLHRKREEHERAIENLELSAKAIEDRIRILGDLAASEDRDLDPIELSIAGSSGRQILRGASIREVAIPLLLKEIGENPIHYKHWYELLERAGYEVVGKRPDAVFLNQVTRSPLVKGSTQPGIYLLDLEAMDRLRAALEEQESRLAEASAVEIPADSRDFKDHVEQNHELATSVARLRRQLDEALRAVEAAQDDPGLVAQAA